MKIEVEKSVKVRIKDMPEMYFFLREDRNRIGFVRGNFVYWLLDNIGMYAGYDPLAIMGDLEVVPVRLENVKASTL